MPRPSLKRSLYLTLPTLAILALCVSLAGTARSLAETPPPSAAAPLKPSLVDTLRAPWLARWSGDALRAPAGFTPLAHLADSVIGLIPSGPVADPPSDLRLIEPYREDELYLFVSAAEFERLGRGLIPPAWQSILPASGPAAPSPAELAAIPDLARDGARVLIRLPESMRAVAQSPGGRCRPLPSPADRAAAAALAEARTARWRAAGIDPEDPAAIALPHAGSSVPGWPRLQPPEFWQSLVHAVNTNHFEADLDYLSTTLRTRYSYSPQMDLACQYVHDAFAALGLATSFDSFTWNGHALKNVLAVKPGTVDPSRIYVVLGHLDSISPNPQTLAPGADDNGSGAVGVLEAARLFATIPTDYTIYFLCVTAEEQGLIGSEHFAAMADQQNLDIRGVLTFDMIGWYDPAGADLWIEGFRQGVSSLWLMTMLQQNAQTYAGLSTYLYPGEGWGSDHEPFHDHGFPAILSIENEWDDYPCYHQTCDTVDQLTASFWQKIVAANVVTLGQLAQAQGALGEIDGEVTVAGGGDPEGATLRLRGTTYPPAQSGESGAFTLAAILPGTYTVEAELSGYAPVTAMITVESGEMAALEVHFETPLPASIAGTVRGRTGLPLPGARIEIEGEPGWTLSSFDGSFTLAPVSPGTVNLSASSAGLLPRGVTVSLAPGQELSGLDLVLAPSWDFETSSEGLIPSAGWEWGVDPVAGAHSGESIWGTRLGADYEPCADYILALPPVSLRSYPFARLRVQHWISTQAAVDGGHVEASIDGGESWQIIEPLSGYGGTLGGPCHPMPDEAGFSGASGEWIETIYPLDLYLGGWVRLRFRFGADAAIEGPGWYLDDLALQASAEPSSTDNPHGTGPGRPTPDGTALPAMALSVEPNPSVHGVFLSASLSAPATASLAIFAADGRHVTTLCASRPLGAGRHDFRWDGTDRLGRVVAAGTYWARLEAGVSAVTHPVVRVR